MGRSAAAKELDKEAVRLAVTAHVRHAETNYDDLLLHGIERQDAAVGFSFPGGRKSITSLYLGPVEPAASKPTLRFFPLTQFISHRLYR